MSADPIDRLRIYRAASPEERAEMIRARYAAQEAERERDRASPYGRIVVPGFSGRPNEISQPIRYWNLNW